MTLSAPLQSTDFPDLPLTCLETAEVTSTHRVVHGKHTVIDLWTTKCTRCPAALDKLNDMASNDAAYSNVQFMSICCDKLDGAREIIEETDEPRWKNIHHYFMEHSDKELAKQVLGFKAVPFYVVLNDRGEIVMKGNSKSVDFDKIPGMVKKASVVPVFSNDDNKENVPPKDVMVMPVTPSPGKSEKKLPLTTKVLENSSPVGVDRVFVIDDDF